MEKHRYCVYRELMYHYGNGEPDRSTSKLMGYTWATSQAAAIRNVRRRTKSEPIYGSLYGPGISERYIAKEA